MEVVTTINGRVGITQKWLLEQGIIKSSALKMREQRQTVVALTRGCRNVSKVYEYKSLPEDMKRAIDARLNVYASAKKNVLEQYIAHDAEASRYFDEYTTDKGAHLPNTQEKPVRQTYYANAIVLKAIVRWEQAVAKRGGRLDWEQVAESIRSLDRLDYACDLPENARKLREKVRAYKQEGLESLVHKNYRGVNTNAVKVHAGEQEDLLIALIAEHRNFDCEDIAKMYNAQCAIRQTSPTPDLRSSMMPIGHQSEIRNKAVFPSPSEEGLKGQATKEYEWKPITASTVRQWQKKVRFITTASKHGAAAFNNTMTYQVKRTAPSKAMYMWVLDGWDAELLYQSKKGNKTTYHNRLTVEVVLDAATKYPIGWAVGETESAELIREALRNAERHVEELTGAMLMPHQIQCDNFARKAMMETYTGLAQYVTPAAVGNAKAKIIEPWFRTLNDKYCKYMPNWSGHGVTAGKAGQPNMDITLKQKSQLPTADAIIMEVAALMGVYRRDALPAYQSAMAALPAEERMVLGTKQYLRLFGESTGQTYTLRGTGINVRIDGKPHQYDLLANPEDKSAMAEAIRFRERCWEKWNVVRDPLDTAHILVENKDRTEQYVLTLKDEQPMALKDRKPGDYEKLAAIWKFNQALKEHVTETLSGYQQRAMQTSPTAPEEGLAEQAIEKRNYEMLSKALITDSRGQHKSERYAAERGTKDLPNPSFKGGACKAIGNLDPFKAAPKTEEEEMWDDV